MGYSNPYELLYMIRTGDPYAEKELYESYKGFIIDIVDSIIHNDQRLMIYRDDLIQDGQIAMVDAVDYYREDRDAGFNTFLNVVVKHAVNRALYKKYIRESIVQLHKTTSYEDLNDRSLFSCQHSLMDPVYHLHMHEAEDCLWKTVEGMNRKEKAVFYSVVRQEPCGYAAERLQMSYSAYANKKMRVRKKLREALLVKAE